MAKPKEIQSGLVSSMNASCRVQEVQSILSKTNLESSKVKKTTMGFIMSGEKATT